MALGKSSNQRPPIIRVNLGRGENAGFHHKVGVDEKQEKIINSYDHVTGVPVALFIKEELIYAVSKELRDKGLDPNAAKMADFDPDQKRHVGSLHMRDVETGDVVAVSIDLSDSLGGKVVGMAHAQILAGLAGQEVKLRTFYAPPHSRYNTTDKGHDSINMAPFDSANPTPSVKPVDIKPVFLDNEGQPMYKDDGTPQPLPMGVITGRAKGKDIWDFSARNDIILETALAVSEHYQALKNAPADNAAQHHGDEEDGLDLNSLDLNEAAAAASATPRA